MKNFCYLLLSLSLVGCLKTRTSLKEDEQRSTAQTQIAAIQKNTAEAQNKTMEIEERLREHNGRLEVLENKEGRSAAEMETYKKSMTDSNLELQKKVAILQEEVVKMENQIAAFAAELSQKGKSEKTSETPKAKDKKSNYDSAQEFFNQKEWKKAILSYQKYRDDNPKGKHIPDATYKIGVCFQELGMGEEAKTFYEEVVSKFATSEEAKRAKIRLKSLKR